MTFSGIDRLKMAVVFVCGVKESAVGIVL